MLWIAPLLIAAGHYWAAHFAARRRRYEVVLTLLVLWFLVGVAAVVLAWGTTLVSQSQASGLVMQLALPASVGTVLGSAAVALRRRLRHV